MSSVTWLCCGVDIGGQFLAFEMYPLELCLCLSFLDILLRNPNCQWIQLPSAPLHLNTPSLILPRFPHLRMGTASSPCCWELLKNPLLSALTSDQAQVLTGSASPNPSVGCLSLLVFAGAGVQHSHGFLPAPGSLLAGLSASISILLFYPPTLPGWSENSIVSPLIRITKWL